MPWTQTPSTTSWLFLPLAEEVRIWWFRKERLRTARNTAQFSTDVRLPGGWGMVHGGFWQRRSDDHADNLGFTASFWCRTVPNCDSRFWDTTFIQVQARNACLNFSFTLVPQALRCPSPWMRSPWCSRGIVVQKICEDCCVVCVSRISGS